ncbi:hypothetical protein WJX84_000461 [Apatococcus fuscideae]|uniref:Uncharacterized protein n=1 Tax=Apatococcus fuscideae TaxID=2026836 RepID=A0AAW1SCM4_9CHLO
MTEPLAAASRADEGEYKAQLEHKISRVKDLFQGFQLPELEIFESQRSHYRMRAEFRVWHQDDETNYIMFDTREKAGSEAKQIKVETFPVGTRLLNDLMAKLMVEIKQKPILRIKLYQTNFHTTLSGEAIITLIYHKKLDAEWSEAAEALRTQLGSLEGCSQEKPFIVGRSRKQKVELGGSAVTEQLIVDGRSFSYQQLEGSFSQPNAGVCQHMLGWARRASEDLEGDLLELYCGNGNFTVALADIFRKVLATEVAKSGVASAHENLKANAVTNAFVARLSSEEFTSAWKKERAFSRLQGTNLDTYDLQTILVDPPHF